MASCFLIHLIPIQLITKAGHPSTVQLFAIRYCMHIAKLQFEGVGTDLDLPK